MRRLDDARIVAKISFVGSEKPNLRKGIAMSEKTHEGWWFSGVALRDGRPLPAVGEWLVHDGPLIPCAAGLHWSSTPWDALRYAPGPLLHKIEARGETLAHGNPVDKYVSRERRILATVDATAILRRFAADQALSVANLWDMPPVVRDYLTTLDESLRAAAWDVARDAARDAARAAAWDAAWDAARDAAWAAARTEFNNRMFTVFSK